MNVMIPRPRVLIVDDEFLIAAEIEAILLDAGYTATIATSREQALAALAEERPQLAIVDLHLGGGAVNLDVMDALETAGIPYVICTGSIAEETDERFSSATIVTKPFLTEDILAAARGKLGTTIDA